MYKQFCYECRVIMRLRCNPFQIFTSSKTPAGLYARQKWLHEQTTATLKADLQETVTGLLSSQASDGSWDHSVVKTVRRLFGLHLTVRTQSEPINKALDWLLDQTLTTFPHRRIDMGEHLTRGALRSLPFTKGCSGLFMTGATLFLASIFGRENDSTILEVYRRLNLLNIKNKGRWCGWSCSNNILRAFVVHPHYSQAKAVVLAVEALAGVQQQSGTWLREVPFYQTVNALAHVSISQADVQLERAFKRLYETQRHDGTWGRSHKEWDTFLIIHALKNKKEL